MINWRDDLPRWEQIVRIVKRRIERGLIYTRPNLGSFVGPEPPDDE